VQRVRVDLRVEILAPIDITIVVMRLYPLLRWGEVPTEEDAGKASD
jgi:hypothetical protein